MLNVVIIGASGYAGAELAALVQKHPHLNLKGLYVSANSQDANKPFSTLYPRFAGLIDMHIAPLNEEGLAAAKEETDLVCLATAHEVSMALAPQFLAAGIKVFDLSGAFRVEQDGFYDQFYGFTHNQPAWLEKAVYGLAEWNDEAIAQAELIAVPGCYPTASLTALKPLQQAGLIKAGTRPIINAVSGVSGAGRKAALNTSFCEVSLNPYGVFTHRHQPEISHHLGTQVIFQPHLGNFARGILATIYVQMAEGVTSAEIDAAYASAYTGKPIVRLQPQWPSIAGVAGTPFCDLHWQLDGDQLIVVSAIDNLLKGASAQAMQCINLNYGFEQTCSLC